MNLSLDELADDIDCPMSSLKEFLFWERTPDKRTVTAVIEWFKS